MTEGGMGVEHGLREPETGFLARWHRTPLYFRILGALALGVPTGLLLEKDAVYLGIPAELILRLMGALAPPLILVAVINALLHAQLGGGMAARLVRLLALNTVVAICIGILVANVVRPGDRIRLKPEEKHKEVSAAKNPLTQFLDNVPTSLVKPLVENNVIGVILIAVAFGIALRGVKHQEVRDVSDFFDLAFRALLVVLHWIIDLVPIGVFGIVAKVVGVNGFRPFAALGLFIVAVILALLLQASDYLTRVALGSWVRPAQLLRGCRDALVMAFSTASSTATMPVTYSCLRDRVGLRQESASMGALVGANFNNDGTALYEAMAALFISQMIGAHLSPFQQLTLVATSVVASVGAAGIPEAGLVTMTLVFHAAGLPTEYIGILLTVDWFLDRCRTMINVMGDMNVSCLLDGRQREIPAAVPAGA